MERSEPTLIPEWLKSSSSTGAQSQSHADDISASRVSKNKSSVHWPSGFERNTSSSYFRRGSGGSISGDFRSYSSSGRSHRDREWKKDKFSSSDQEKTFLENRRHWEFSEPEGTPVLSKFERDGLRRSRSMVSGKHGDTWPKKIGTDLTGAVGNSTDGLLYRVSSPIQANKTLFERDFPSLGSEERSSHPDVGRIPSPGLTSAIQSLPIGSSTSLGEKWTSALAEVPVLAVSNGSALSSVSQVASSGSSSVVLGSTAGLNMAEAVTNGPIRAQISPQLSVGTQRREELAIKQSRQLIPVIPHMSKTLALNSSDKSKGKAGQLLPLAASVPASHSPRSVSGKVDASKSSNPGKLQVLKSAREKNGLTHSVKDNTSPTSSGKVGSLVVVASASAATGNQMNTLDRKPVLTVVEKRPTFQAQSRNEFFKSVRMKSMEIPSSAADSDSSCSSSVVEHYANCGISPSYSDKLSEINMMLPANDTEAADIPQKSSNINGKRPNVDDFSEEKAVLNCNGDASNMNGKRYPCSDPIISDEEEAAFLRSMGWDENDEEGGLTEEEISSFRTNLSKYVESNPSPRILQGTHLRFLLPLDSHTKEGKV